MKVGAAIAAVAGVPASQAVLSDLFGTSVEAKELKAIPMADLNDRVNPEHRALLQRFNDGDAYTIGNFMTDAELLAMGWTTRDAIVVIPGSQEAQVPDELSGQKFLLPAVMPEQQSSSGWGVPNASAAACWMTPVYRTCDKGWEWIIYYEYCACSGGKSSCFMRAFWFPNGRCS